MFSTDNWHNDRKKPHKIFDCQTLEDTCVKRYVDDAITP